MPIETKAGSLRERRKAQTRKELVTVANRLFRRQGYAETTLDQIVEESGVSLRTLLRYFDSKLHLALADHSGRLEKFRARIEDPERELDTVSCWREHVEHSARALTDTRAYASYLKFVVSVPALEAGLREIYREYVDVIADALAVDAGVDREDDLYGRLLAVMLVEGNSMVARRWMKRGREGDLKGACLAVVDFAMENFPPRHTQRLRAVARGG